MTPPIPPTGAMTRRKKSVLFLRISSTMAKRPVSFFEFFPTAVPHCKVALPHRLGVTSHIRISLDMLQNLSERGFLLPLTLYPFLFFPRSFRWNLSYFCSFKSEVHPHSAYKLFISHHFPNPSTMRSTLSISRFQSRLVCCTNCSLWHC